MKIATWNINSVRLRQYDVLRFIKENKIDVICLQETKTEDQFFPSETFSKIGMNYQYFRGEKSLYSCYIGQKQNFGIMDINWCNKNDCRHISVKIKDKLNSIIFIYPLEVMSQTFQQTQNLIIKYL